MSATHTEALLRMPEIIERRSLVIKNKINDQMINISASTDKPTEVLNALKRAIVIELGVKNSLEAWLRNTYQPSLMQLVRISYLLDCKLDDLIVVEDEKND